MKRVSALMTLALMIGGMAAQAQDELLMPDVEQRREKLLYKGDRFLLPDGFKVEEVATNELIRSCINMTFDHLGRPMLASERFGIFFLEDPDGDGHYEEYKVLTREIGSAQGMYVVKPGEYLFQANGPEGTGLYRVLDTDLDDKADEITLLIKSDAGMQEHGPHAIQMGPDGKIYLMYGNHAHPITDLNPLSPSRGLQEDFFLPRYLDPRGHANSVRAPGGTINRLSSDLKTMSQLVGGFRNQYDFAMDLYGEMFTFDSDMEWDVGLPWFRPIRVLHSVPGADFGWRTGSSKKPFYYLDTLPGVDDVGRGSPVGVAIYQHNAFPEKYRGAVFMGDWSRGRIRVLFPRRSGGSFEGKTLDFLVGEPLNVTDLDIGPDGNLYFLIGGRGTNGGMFKISYTGPRGKPAIASTLDGVVMQPMPRSAWGKEALRKKKIALGDGWESGLRGIAEDAKRPTSYRIRALEALQVLGPQPDTAYLGRFIRDTDAEVRAFAVYLLGTHPLDEIRTYLDELLGDSSAVVLRRTCEAFVQAGLTEATRVGKLVNGLFPLLDHEDRFVRYAARLTLSRVHREAWEKHALKSDMEEHPHGTLEGLLALAQTQRAAVHADALWERLNELSKAEMSDDVLLDYLRVVQMASIRDVAKQDDRSKFEQSIGTRMLRHFPSKDWRVNRELQVVTAGFKTPGAIEKLLANLTPDQSQEEQIHTVFCLRTIPDGWTEAQRNTLVAWFDRGREIRGAASMEGFVNNLWNSTMALLPEDEQVVAQTGKTAALAARRAKSHALMAQLDEAAGNRPNGMVQRSFEELAEYLEYDPMAYRAPNLERGEQVFLRGKCMECHVFGSIGRGGGPDLSTVASRFRRRDLLEAIMYPSRVISDQYSSVDVEMSNGDFHTGMVVGEGQDTLTIITAQGERMELRTADIKERFESEISIMPEGLLDTMSQENLVDLVQFLENGGDL